MSTELKTYQSLRFYVDDQQVGYWTGTEAYRQFSYYISSGRHQLRWTYKSSSYSGGEVAIDDVYIPALGDEDGDGILDGWEYRYFDGLEAVLSRDSDGDGLTDLEGYREGTDPLVP